MLSFLLLFLITFNGYSQTITCSGSCSCPPSGSNTCILRCIGGDKCKDGTLTCRSGSPCQVICDGNSACGGDSKIDASDATNVDITCTGTDACKGNTIIDCGTGNCAVSCDGSTSCENAEINAPNADSFVCSGSCSSTDSVPAPYTAPPTPKPTTKTPSNNPTNIPSKFPTNNPTLKPTNNPIQTPTKYPTKIPTFNPTYNPSISPSNTPTTPIPTINPSMSPSEHATTVPSTNPSQSPTVTEQHAEVDEPEQSVDDSNIDEFDVSNNEHLNAWVYIVIACTGIFCCLMILLVLFKCGVFKRKQYTFEHKVNDDIYDQGYGNEHMHESNKQSNHLESCQPQVVGDIQCIPLSFEGEFDSTVNSNLKHALAIISGNSRPKNVYIPSDEEVSSDSNEYVTTAGGLVNSNNNVQMAMVEGIDNININPNDIQVLDEIDQIVHVETLGDGNDFTIGCDDEETICVENDDEIDNIPNSSDVNDKMTIGSENMGNDYNDDDIHVDDIITPQGDNYIVQEEESDDSEDEYITIQ